MAFISIPESWIQVGEALKKELFDYIKENLDSLYQTVFALQDNAKRVDVCNLEVGGYINQYSSSELVGIHTYICQDASFVINTFKVKLLNNSPTGAIASSGGELKLNLMVSKDNGLTFNSILQNGYPISLQTYNTGSESSPAVFASNNANLITYGQILRIDIVSKMTVQGSFQIICEGEI